MRMYRVAKIVRGYFWRQYQQTVTSEMHWQATGLEIVDHLSGQYSTALVIVHRQCNHESIRHEKAASEMPRLGSNKDRITN